MRHILITIILLPLLLVLLPLAGIMLRGIPLAPYLQFPPLTRYVEHAPFSLPVFILLVLLLLAVLLPLVRRLLHGFDPGQVTPHRFLCLG